MEIIEKTFTTNGTMNTRKTTERIILHHAAAKKCTVEDVDRWHKNKGWAKIGYHFFIAKDGKIYRGREEDKVGAHAYGSNYNSIGICFEGDYMTEDMPKEQLESGKELVAYIKNKYGISTVQSHKEVNATSCSGDKFPFDEIANVKKTNDDDEKPSKDIGNGIIAGIQSTLNERYGLKISVDNIYGNETKKALIKGLQTELNSQFKRGIAVDGIFGNATYNACISVRKGAEGNITWLIQAMLVCHSINIEIDKIFGKNTENAVKKFQARNGLTADGIVGKDTFRKLFA